MEFGKVNAEEIFKVNFELPADGKQTRLSLVGERSATTNFYVGCAKWGRKEWVDLIYPPKTKEKDFLSAYVKHFNSIELNAVFYSIPKEEQILKWKAVAENNREFIFCPKFSRTITHIKRLNNAQVETDWYLKAISAFGNQLGPCFLQLGENFGPKNFEILHAYLKSLPVDLKLFLEVRHEDWFKEGEDRERLFAMLAALNIGAVITDASGRRDCVHMELPTPKAFIRFVGNGKPHLQSDKDRIDEWVKRLRVWLDNGLEEVYFFLHQHDESDTPVIADYTIAQFNKYLGAHLSRLNFISKNNLLF